MVASDVICMTPRTSREVVNNEDNATTMGTSQKPEEKAGNSCIGWSTVQLVLDRVGNTQVALDADSHEEQEADINAAVEEEVCQWAKNGRKRPCETLGNFCHLEGQKEQKEKVRNGQIEQQDIYGDRLATYFPQEGVAGQKVARQTNDEGNDIDSKDHDFVLHLLRFCKGI